VVSSYFLFLVRNLFAIFLVFIFLLVRAFRTSDELALDAPGVFLDEVWKVEEPITEEVVEKEVNSTTEEGVVFLEKRWVGLGR
jgi:hypothetical protein